MQSAWIEVYKMLGRQGEPLSCFLVLAYASL